MTIERDQGFTLGMARGNRPGLPDIGQRDLAISAGNKHP
jgi:hypothetical protein